MPKQAQATNAVYKVTEIIGTSTKSWEDAARNAVETAARTLRDLRVAEVVKTDLKVENGKVTAYRAGAVVVQVQRLSEINLRAGPPES